MALFVASNRFEPLCGQGGRMILTKIIEQLKREKKCSVKALSLHVGSSEEAVLSMLLLLESKGKVRKSERVQPGCGTKCRQCAVGVEDYYEWVDSFQTIQFVKSVSQKKGQVILGASILE